MNTLQKARFALYIMNWDTTIIMDGFIKRHELNTPVYRKLERILNHAYTQLPEFYDWEPK